MAKALQTPYQNVRARRSDISGNAGRLRGGELIPYRMDYFGPSESGTVSSQFRMILDPIEGDLLTPMRLYTAAVFVPLQAILKQGGLTWWEQWFQNTETEFFSEDAIRDRFARGLEITGMEAESDISREAMIHPDLMPDGSLQVNEEPRHAYNAAVSFLRRRRHREAEQVDSANTSILSAILSRTALDIMGGVLDPEDRNEGRINFTLDGVTLPVKGAGIDFDPDDVESITYTNSDGEVVTEDGINIGQAYGSTSLIVKKGAGDHPDLYVDISDGTASALTLDDFYKAEKQRKITRMLDAVLQRYPEFGEQMVANFVHGMSIPVDGNPLLLHEDEKNVGELVRHASSSGSLDESQTDGRGQDAYSVIVPKTEFGGVVVHMAALKPEETLPRRPHPFFARPLGGMNYAQDELKTDPVALPRHKLDFAVPLANRDDVVMYTGYQHERRAYQTFGWNRNTNPNDVAIKSSLWTMEVPSSVGPTNIQYPDPGTIDHYPFADGTGDVATYLAVSSQVVNTPMVFGPKPMERIDVLESTIDIDPVE